MDLQLPRELKRKIAKWKAEMTGNTLLHLAAQAGQLMVCRYLIEELDMPIRELNGNKKEPRDLAQNNDVKDYLSSTYNLTQTRFGQGDAVQEALASKGQVVEVTWYTRPLRDWWAGKLLGGKHSFLVIEVDNAGTERKQAKYIMERARPANNVETHCGVFIGKWETHGPWQGNVLISNAHVEGSISLSDGKLKVGITMKQLYDVQQQLGHYNVAKANCHHGAMRAFNDCCKQARDKIPEWKRPNRLSAHLAPLIGLGCSGFESRSTVSGVPLKVESQDSRSLSSSQPDDCSSCFPSGFQDRFSAEAAQKRVMSEAAYLSCKVYDDMALPSSSPPSETTAQSASDPNHDLQVLHFAPKSARRPIQWLLARSTSALFVCFRGTHDVQDVAVDLAATPLASRHTVFGLGLHPGMYAALEQEAPHLNVLQEILSALQCYRQESEPLVLCGHSLGGGYAQIVALHLLHGGHVEHSKMKVQTCGAPHIVIPPQEEDSGAAKDLWHLLSSCSEHLVNAWDPVPRLPLCSKWLTDVIPKLGVERCGFKFSLELDFVNEEQVSLLLKYDVAGKVVMAGKGISEACCRASACQQSQKDLLSEVPPREVMTVQRLPAYHSMADYLCIAEQLRQAPAA